MLKKIVVVALALAPALAWGAIIPAGGINETPHANEQSLWRIVNTLYGTSFAQNDDLLFAQVGTEIFPGGMQVTASASVVYAGNTQTFGWYEAAAGPVTTNPLFTVSGTGYNATGSGSFTAWNDFGFYLSTAPHGGNNTWYSEVSRNSDGIVHQALFDLALLTGNASYAGSYLSAWEDLPFGTPRFDADYNDLVLQLDMNIIPEPSTMILLGLGLAGFTARRFRQSKS